jgi:ribose 5-phosphate isomerase A
LLLENCSDPFSITLLDPPAMEAELNNVAGVVTNGIFARRPADVLLLAEPGGVRMLSKK